MAAPQRSPHTPSTGIPSGRSSKHLSLLPTPRRPSFSTPAPTSPPSLSGFRAFRSLLPFGPNKSSTPVSSSVGPNPNGSRFASFSSVRKSISKDRNASLSSPMLPVMVIDRSADDSAEFPTRKSVSLYGDKPLPDQSVSPPKSSSQLPAVNLPSSSSSEDPRRAPPGSPTVTFTYEDTTAPPTAVFIPPVRTPSPLPAELSTIIEADTSGISKHLPSASPSPSPSPISPNQPILHEENSAADETSALDLSTTHLTSQVVDAMMAQEYGATKAWLDAAEEQNRLANASSDHVDVSFNLSSLDPDLAALLSPNRMAPSESNNTIKAKSSTDLLLSPPSSPHQPLHQSSRPRLRPIQRPSTSPTEGTRSVSVSSSAHSRTARRAPPSPLSTSHPPSPTLSSAIPASPLSSSIPAPTSSTPASMRRPQHSSSASSSTQTTTRRPLLGRMLQSDNWEGASSSSRTGLTRPSLDSAGYRPSSVASTSRTSLDTSRHRPSLDSNRHNSSANSTNNNTVRERPRNTPSPTWNAKLRRPRKRSMSVDEPRASPPGYTSPPSSSMSGRPEWLGPRTAKAFKAAGLLGSSDSVDGDDHASPPPRSKFGFGSMRSSSTVGRSTTDSRLGMVSPGGLSARRRGSGSGSYFGGGSQLMESPTLTMSSRDTPRSASTAPTSVSGASWGREEREEVRELKDKHAVETGALLSALSDSQRTTKVLREENVELRERLARLEEQMERSRPLERENQALREFVSELREEAGQLKLQLRLAAPVASSSRYLAPAITQPFRLPARGSVEQDLSEDSYSAPHFSSTPATKTLRKRLSSETSSIFPAPPSNMSLLLHEDGANSSDLDDTSMSASQQASPTMVRLAPRAMHRNNKSITSMANTSPNASMLGSPRSLLLRPEHEMHLGDMDSLDLGRTGPDDGDEDWSE